jgi:dTDP-4-dehydrorhamnose reductase
MAPPGRKAQPPDPAAAGRDLPRTTVIGGRGYLGRHLLRAYQAADPDVRWTDVAAREGAHPLDLAAPDIRPLRLRESGYQHAAIAAAVTGLARCEQDRDYTRARNVDGTLELARQLAGVGVVPVLFSTDLVFDGQDGRYSDDAPTHPLNEYGAQKAEVERRLPEVCGGRCLIIRLGKVFGLARGDGTLLDEMAGRLTNGQEVAAARDQVFSPVLVGDVVRAVLALQATGVTGVVNVGGPEVWSRFDLAQAVARALGAAPALVRGISLDDLKELFRRPKRTDLLCRRLNETVNLEFRPMAACVASFAERYREGRT